MENIIPQGEKKTKIYEEIIKYGLVLGLVFFVFGIILLYLISGSESFMVSIIAYPIIFQLIIPIVAVIFLCISLRKQIGGYWTFRQALKSIFIMFIVGWLLSFGLNLGYTKLVDRNIITNMQSQIKNNSEVFMKKQGIGEEQLDAEMEKLDEQFAKQQELSASTLFKNITIAIPVIFVIALIFAAIFKRERPISLTNFEDQPQA
jgi:hypothetical protein